jgi:hypothetical protein
MHLNGKKNIRRFCMNWNWKSLKTWKIRLETGWQKEPEIR